MILRSILALFTAFSMSFLGCAQGRSDDMSVEELKTAIKKDKNLVLIDVRTPAELQAVKIDGVINIPVQELESRINEVEKYKGKNIVLICRSGNRSGVAQGILEKKGIKSRNVIGGMNAWQKMESN